MTGALTTYVDYGKSQVAQLREDIYARTSVAPEIAVEVVFGAQEGTFTVLDESTFTIGGDHDADIFLANVTPSHPVTVSATNSVFGLLVTVETARKDVVLNDKSVAGKLGPVRAPCALTVGDNGLLIEADTKSAAIAPSQRTKFIALAIAIAIFIGAFVAASFASPTNAHVISRSGPQVRSVAPTATQAVTQANAQIAAAGLEGAVTATFRGANTIALVGTLSPAQAQTWAQVQPGVDSALSSFTVLRTMSTRTALSAVPPVGMAVLGSSPALILGSGQSIEPGAELVDGWMLMSVTRDGFTVKRDDDEVFVRYE